MGREAQPTHSRLMPRLEADLPRINFTAFVSFWNDSTPLNRCWGDQPSG